MEAFMKKIAVVILTKNEEKNIVAVIENVRKITDEIIIIDSGSDDATVGLANLHGARVLTVNGIMIFQLSAILF